VSRGFLAVRCGDEAEVDGDDSTERWALRANGAGSSMSPPSLSMIAPLPLTLLLTLPLPLPLPLPLQLLAAVSL
jgi:hypothetical protein